MPPTPTAARLARAAAPVVLGPAPDLRALDRAIGDARVVLLGEQSHGDGAAFAAKARIVEHLHRNRGFDVLAFEADFYALERAWREARGAAGSRGGGIEALARHVYGHWREAPSVAPLWRLVRERLGSDRPLIVAGIDPRHSGAYEKAGVADALEAHLAAAGVPHAPDWEAFRALLVEMLEREYAHRVDAGERVRFLETLLRLRESLVDPHDEACAFWRQELANLAWTARNAWGFEGRDEGMGRNLAWLARERHPAARIVVWTHNFHIVRSAAALDPHHPPYRREREKHPDTPLGEVAVRELGDEVRSIALVAGGGWYAPDAWRGDRVSRAELAPPAEGSLEAHLLRRGLESGVLDLRGETEAFTVSGVEHETPIHAPWGRIFDGVLYLRTMTGLDGA